MVQQESHHIPVALPAGQGEGDVVLTARGDVNLRSFLQQQLCHSQVALPGECVLVLVLVCEREGERERG